MSNAIPVINRFILTFAIKIIRRRQSEALSAEAIYCRMHSKNCNRIAFDSSQNACASLRFTLGVGIGVRR